VSEPICPTPHKRQYSTKRIAKRSNMGRQKFARAYLCPSGLHWHVTTQRPDPGGTRRRLEPVA
jgi:hypothetical protein